MKFETALGAIAVNVSNLKAVQSAISQKIKDNQSFALATVNLDHLAKLDTDPVFYKAYSDQDFVVADGNPIVWLSRIASFKVDLLPGSDMIEPLCEQMAEMDAPIALLGATEESLEKAGAFLTRKYPGLNIVLKLSPPFGFDPESSDADDVLRKVDTSGARLCFLAFGAPKQEILAARGKHIATQTGFVSIGAGLDFLAGVQDRAPLWVRKIAMEWLWRLVGDPKRLTLRYAKCLIIFPKHMLQAVKHRMVRN